MFGPSKDVFLNIYTWFTIIALSIPYFIVTSQTLWNEFSPAIVIANYIFFVSTIVTLLFT